MSLQINRLVVLGLFVCSLVCAEADALSTYSVEELSKSKALQAFLIHKYDEALNEFRALLVEYPDNVLLERYVGACLSELRRDDEAIIAFNLVLLDDPKDLPAHKFLAKIRLRRGETVEAREHLKKLVVLDTPDGRFALYAKSQLEQLDRIGVGDLKVRAGQVGAEFFMSSKATQYFMDANYEKALTGYEALEELYPEDLMVKRYKGLTLDKLNRYPEALETFQKGLALDPDNAALRYAMAQTRFRNHDWEGSSEDLRVLSQGSVANDYKVRAGQDLEVIERLQTTRQGAEGKKWSIILEQGAEFNSNAASEPTKVPVTAEEHAIRFPGSLYASYLLKQEGPWSLTGSYVYAHSFYSDTLNYLNTLVHAPTISVAHLGAFAGKPLVTLFSSSYVHVSVAEEFYYQSYPQSLRWIYSLWDRHQMILAEKIAWTDYKDQGAAPTSTSREGISNAVNVTNNFYFNDKRDLYLSVGYEFKAEDTDGSDYVRNVHQVNTDFNFPVWKDWKGLVSFRYKNSDYPETVQPIAREDNEYLVDTNLTVPLNKVTSLKFFYDYLKNDSNDVDYAYTNHSGGASLISSF